MGTSTGQSVETTQQERSNRVCYLDVLNVIACFAVIMLHCSNDVFDNVGDVLWVRCAITQSAPELGGVGAGRPQSVAGRPSVLGGQCCASSSLQVTDISLPPGPSQASAHPALA